MPYTFLDFIKHNRSLGLSDDQIGIKFRSMTGFSPIGVDPLQALPGELTTPVARPATTGEGFETLSQYTHPAAGFRHAPQAVAGLLGSAIGAVAAPVAAIGSAITGAPPPKHPELNTIPAAFAAPMQTMNARRELPTYETVPHSGRDFFTGVGTLGDTAVRTSTGTPPVGHRGDYSVSDAFHRGVKTGADVSGGIIGGVPGVLAAAMPFRATEKASEGVVDAWGDWEFAPSETIKAMQVLPFELGALAGPSVLRRARTSRMAETPHRTWKSQRDTPPARTYEESLRKGVVEPEGGGPIQAIPDEAIEALVSKRFPERSSIKEVPVAGASTGQRAAKTAVMALVGNAVLDYAAPGVGALVFGAAPEFLRFVGKRASPKAKRWATGIKQWAIEAHHQGTPATTEIGRISTRMPAEVVAEVGGLVEEFAGRVERGEARLAGTFDDAKMAERPAAKEVAVAPDKAGEVGYDPAALASAADVDLYASQATEGAAGHKAAGRIRQAEATEARKPFVEPARELKEMAAGEQKIASGERKVASEIMERAKREKDAAGPRLAELDTLKAANFAEAAGQRALAEAEHNVGRAKQKGATAATEQFSRGQALGKASLLDEASSLAAQARKTKQPKTPTEPTAPESPVATKPEPPPKTTEPAGKLHPEIQRAQKLLKEFGGDAADGALNIIEQHGRSDPGSVLSYLKDSAALSQAAGRSGMSSAEAGGVLVDMKRAQKLVGEEGRPSKPAPGDAARSESLKLEQDAKQSVIHAKSTHAESIRSTNPKIKAQLQQIAKASAAAAKQARRDAKMARESAAIVGKIAGFSKKAVASMTRAELEAALADVAATREVANRFVDSARKHAAIATKLRAVVADVYQTNKRSAQYHGAAAKRSAEVAKRLRQQAADLYELADEAGAPYKAASKKAKAEAKSLETSIVDEGVATAEGRAAKAGLITKPEPDRVSLNLKGADDIVDRIVEAGNRSSAPSRPRLKREAVVKVLTDALNKDGLTLALSPRARGAVYAHVAKLMPKGVRDVFMKSFDDAIVEASKSFMSKEQTNLKITMPDGTSKTIRQLLVEVGEEMAAKDPKGYREWQAEAVRATGPSLGGVLEKALTAQELVNEAKRFTYKDTAKKVDPKKDAQPADITHLDGKTVKSMIKGNEARPLMAPHEVVRQIDPKVSVNPDASFYAKVPDRVRDFMMDNSPDKAIPKDLYIDKGFLKTIETRLDGMELVDKATWGVKLAQHIRLGYTAYNLPTSKGNSVANVVIESGTTGVDPITVTKGVVEAHRWWTKGSAGKFTGAELREFRGLQKSGAVATNILEDIVANIGKHAKSEQGAVAAVRKTGAAARKFYQAQDAAFKVYSARRNYKIINDKANSLADGRSLWVQLRDGPVVKLKKVDGHVTLRGKTLSEQGLADILANASTVPALGRFFDYTSGGLGLKRRMGSPATSWAAPYFSWPYYAMDIPGVKRGLLTNILDDAGGGFWKTNDPVLVAEGAKEAIRVGARRASLEQAGLMLTDKDRRKYGADLAWGRADESARLAFPTDTPGEADVLKFRQEYVGSASEVIWRMFHSGATAVLGGDWLADTSGDKRAQSLVPGINAQASRKRLRRMWLKKQKGEIVSGEQMLGAVGFGGALIEGMYDEIVGKRGYGRKPTRWDKVVMDFTKMMIGGTPGTVVEVAAGLADPYGDAGNRRTSTVKGKSGPEPAFRYMIRKLLSIGANPIDTEKQFETAMDQKVKMLNASLLGAKKRREKKIKADGTITVEEKINKVTALNERFANLTAMAKKEENDLRMRANENKARFNTNRLPQ